MKPMHIMVVESNHLVTYGVASLLKHVSGLLVEEVIKNNEANVALSVEEMRPDVVIIDETLNAVQKNQILALLEEKCCTRIFEINVNENTAEVFRRQEYRVNQIGDLINLIVQDSTTS